MRYPRSLRSAITAALLGTGLGTALLSGCASTETPTDQSASATSEGKPMTYPQSTEMAHTDDYHGTTVADPYRWLEDADSPETKAWVKAQNDFTRAYLNELPLKKPLVKQLTALWNYERYSAPFKKGGRLLYFKNDGLQNQSVLYVQDEGADKARVLLDPNALSDKGTKALSGLEFSHDGQLMAYAISEGGSDWKTWHVKRVATGEDLTDTVEWSKFAGVSFTKAGDGFFYARYPAPKGGDALEAANYNHTVYFHKLGTSQDADEKVFWSDEDKELGFGPTVTEDGDYLILHVWKGTDRRNRLYVKPLGQKDAKVVKLLDAFDAGYEYVGNKGKTFYFKTDNAAPRGRLIAVDLDNPAPANWKTVIAEHEADKLEHATFLAGGILTTWLHNAHTLVKLMDFDGKVVRDIDLPTIGSASGFAGKSDQTKTWYTFTSFTFPTVVYEVDLKTGETSVYKKPNVNFNPEDYVTEQVFYPSKDGTKVPMFLVYKKGLKRTGDNPTYLYGYGGFNISLTPSFRVSTLAWLERGGVYAQPSLRGGGEFGEAWHQAGMHGNKQNVFDDFAAAAEYLIAEKFTKSARLSIGGGSNGGLLVGASITQRPELFGAARAAVGVMDMLRFHKFTIGHAWVSEYGSSADKDAFDWLIKYSPLHNTKAQAYPATLITTADHDDRVVPAHSFKFTAALQKAQTGPAPTMIRIDIDAGHGAGKPTSMQIDEVADTWAFLAHNLGADQVMTLPTDAE